jgi:uncharacterized protein YdaL
MLDILYNMSADAYAKLVAHNNTVVQQFKTYKEAQERALAEAYGRLSALKEFYAKEREEMREAFEREKQSMRDEIEREKQSLVLEKQSLTFERDRQPALALEKQALAFEREKQGMREAFEREKQGMREVFEREKQSGCIIDKNQILNDALSGFFRNV